MKFFSQIVKIVLTGVWLHGSALLAEDQKRSYETIVFIADIIDHNQTLKPDLLLCKHLKELKKSDFFLELNSLQETRAFYTDYCENSDTLAWSDSSQHLNNQATDLIQSIKDSYEQGLNPNKYHLHVILMHKEAINHDTNQTTAQKLHFLNRIDVLLTDAYITLSHDLYYGFTDWKRFKESKKKQNKKLSTKQDTIEWERAEKIPINLSQYLAINLATNRISDSLNLLSPDSVEYHRLIKSLKYYRMLHAKGGWEKIPSGATIRMLQSDDRLTLIKKRLYISGDLNETENNESTMYAETKLIDAVKSFQTHHNLANDGLIGKKTIDALNISSSMKVSKIILNMERFRWLDKGMDQYQSYININIPAFTMQVLEHGDEVIAMKVIVGTKERPTPILNSKISYAVLNPSWIAPITIVKEDILKKENIKEYLQSHKMRIYSNIDGDMVEVNYDKINWNLYTDKENIPYIFKADAGEANPLGGIKFIFHNKYSVYMHDTNQRHLFKNEYRALSSGCLRLNEPMKLLSYLLEKEDTIREEKRTDKIVYIKKKIPVVIRYMTVSVDKDNHIYFYDDIYGYDTLQWESIKDNSWMQ